MTPHTDDHHPARRSRFWAQPIARLTRRSGPGAAVRSERPAAAPAPAEPLDDGEDLLRRLREAGL